MRREKKWVHDHFAQLEVLRVLKFLLFSIFIHERIRDRTDGPQVHERFVTDQQEKERERRKKAKKDGNCKLFNNTGKSLFNTIGLPKYLQQDFHNYMLWLGFPQMKEKLKKKEGYK